MSNVTNQKTLSGKRTQVATKPGKIRAASSQHPKTNANEGSPIDTDPLEGPNRRHNHDRIC